VFRQEIAEKTTNGDLNGIELSVNAIEKHLGALDQMETATNTIHSNSEKIIKAIKKLRDAAAEEIDVLRNCSKPLKSAT